MVCQNSYATLAELKSYITARGQSAIATDTSDDAVLDNLLEGASRAIDGATNRHFYPTVETRYYCVPEPTDSELMLDDDLLAITTLTNGDSDSISSSDYILLPRNFYPKYSIKLKESSDISWEWDSEGNDEWVISVLGFWGYHSAYILQPAWVLATTLAEDLTAGETAIDLTSAALLQIGQIIKYDNELALITGISVNTLTVSTGYNGSTAATLAASRRRSQ